MTDRRTHRIDFENPCYDTEFATGILGGLQHGHNVFVVSTTRSSQSNGVMVYHQARNVYGGTVDPLTVDQRRRKAKARRRANRFRRMNARG